MMSVGNCYILPVLEECPLIDVPEMNVGDMVNEQHEIMRLLWLRGVEIG